MRSKTETGSVIILLVLIIFALFALLGIAIDTSTVGTATAQARNGGRYAALGAIESYYSSTATNYTNKMNDVRNRLTDLLRLNSIITADSPNTVINPNSIVLTGGKWYFMVDQSGNNPCLTGQSPPCFVPRSGDSPVNAFRVTGNIVENVKTFFAAFLGYSTVSVPVDIVSTITPRQGCFLVDLSPSMTRLTHDPASATGAFYGFYLSADNPGSAQSLGGGHDGRWIAMDPVIPPKYVTRPAGDFVSPIHYRDDYRLISLLNDSNYSTSAAGSNFRKYHADPTTTDVALRQLYSAPVANYQVDRRRISGYTGPQPLTDVMNGLKRAVSLFRTNSVAGDKMCLIFFDQRLSWPRVIKLTDNFDYIDQVITAGVDMNEPDNPSRYGLFPSKDSFTNILMAVTEANRQFTEQKEANPGIPVAQFMTLITDGLSNCVAGDSELNPTFDRNSDGKVDEQDLIEAEVCANPSNCTSVGTRYVGALGCQPGANRLPNEGCKWVNTNGDNIISPAEVSAVSKASYESERKGTQGCQNNYQTYEYATKELTKYIETNITPQQIPIHVMLVGQHVQPNTMDYAKPGVPEKCLSDSEIRALDDNKSFVRGPSAPYRGCTGTLAALDCDPVADTAFTNMSKEAPFIQANIDMYNIARMTRGMWAPLRIPPGLDDPACVASECSPGPRVNDPNCRELNTQIADYMTSIMGQNPYTIAYSQ